MNSKVLETIFFMGLLGGVILLTFFIFQPYLGALFVALVLAVMFEPVYRTLAEHFKKWPGLAAFATVMIVLVVILLPLSYIGAILFQEARDLSFSLLGEQGSTGFLSTTLTSLENAIRGFAPDMQMNLEPQKYVEGVLVWLTDNLGAFFSGFASVIIKTFLMIIALYFFLRDGKKLREVVLKWSPLHDTHDAGILKKVGVAVNSVIKGDILVAVIQGLLAGLGFVIFGVPSPVLWGAVATIGALIPAVGTGIVLLPAVAYLYFAVSVPMAIGLLIWGVFIVGLIDNYLRPTLIHKDVNIHPFIILLSVFGGLSLFGPIGFLVGPIILSLLFALIDVYPDVMKHVHEE
jgi:predicted PurR-regulated permease PerM